MGILTSASKSPLFRYLVLLRSAQLTTVWLMNIKVHKITNLLSMLPKCQCLRTIFYLALVTVFFLVYSFIFYAGDIAVSKMTNSQDSRSFTGSAPGTELQWSFVE